MKYFRLKSTLSLFFTTTKIYERLRMPDVIKAFFPPQYILLYQLSSLNVCWWSVLQVFVNDFCLMTWLLHFIIICLEWSIVVGVCYTNMSLYIHVSTCHSRKKIVGLIHYRTSNLGNSWFCLEGIDPGWNLCFKAALNQIVPTLNT